MRLVEVGVVTQGLLTDESQNGVVAQAPVERDVAGCLVAFADRRRPPASISFAQGRPWAPVDVLARTPT